MSSRLADTFERRIGPGRNPPQQAKGIDSHTAGEFLHAAGTADVGPAIWLDRRRNKFNEGTEVRLSSATAAQPVVAGRCSDVLERRTSSAIGGDVRCCFERTAPSAGPGLGGGDVAKQLVADLWIANRESCVASRAKLARLEMGLHLLLLSRCCWREPR